MSVQSKNGQFLNNIANNKKSHKMQTIPNTNFEQWLSYQAKQNAENKAKIIRMHVQHKRVFKQSLKARLKQFFSLSGFDAYNF